MFRVNERSTKGEGERWQGGGRGKYKKKGKCLEWKGDEGGKWCGIKWLKG